MSEQNQFEIDTELIFRQFEQAAEAFNYLEQAIIEASKAMMVLAAALASITPIVDQQPAPDADWTAANTLMRQGQ